MFKCLITTTPCYFSMIFDFIKTIAFLALKTMEIISKSNIFLLSTILILKNTRVHIGTSDSCNLLTYIKASVNKIFCFYTILRIPNIDLYNSHV